MDRPQAPLMRAASLAQDAPGAVQLAFFLGQAEALTGDAITDALRMLEEEEARPLAFDQAFDHRPFNEDLSRALIRMRKGKEGSRDGQRQALVEILREFVGLATGVNAECCPHGRLVYATEAAPPETPPEDPQAAPRTEPQGFVSRLAAAARAGCDGAAAPHVKGAAHDGPSGAPAPRLRCDVCWAVHDLSGRRLHGYPTGALYPFRLMRRDDFLAQLPHIPEADWPFPARPGLSA